MRPSVSMAHTMRFPRGIPRGLIEAQRILVRLRIVRAVFRGVFPAASLKRGYGAQGDGDGGRFPRGIPRGLIEARWQRGRGRRRRRVFRGVFPAASLKLEKLGFDSGRVRDVFRGVFPAASLKLIQLKKGCRPTPCFPRGIPRGLIEATAPGGSTRVIRTFSAGYSPRPH